MLQYIAPVGEAGLDKLDRMIESIQAELDSMFLQDAKLKSLTYSIKQHGNKLLWHYSCQECEARATHHAGQALERSFHLLYAYSANRVIGRSYPNADKYQLREDRRTHDLTHLYNMVIRDASAANDIKEALNDVYLSSVHKGFVDILLDGDKVSTRFASPEDKPFRNKISVVYQDGSELTQDHKAQDRKNEMPKAYRDFPSFLRKVDSIYYDGKNIQWTKYGFRDYESGRPYAVAGTEFFGRFVKGVVFLATQPWVWDSSIKERWHEIHTHLVKEKIDGLILENCTGPSYKPTMKTLQEYATLHLPKQPSCPDYSLMHRRLDI